MIMMKTKNISEDLQVKTEEILDWLKKSNADKNVLSVSLGSSNRDSCGEIELAGIKIGMLRVGCDGNSKLLCSLFEKFDSNPKISAFGIGGVDLYVGAKKYPKNSENLVKNVKRTPIFDGWGLKDTLERRAIQYLEELFPLKEKTALVMSGADRFGMAEELEKCGCDTIYGDIMFTVRLPIPIRSLKLLETSAGVLLKFERHIPIEKYFPIYPTGKEQEKNTPRFKRIFEKSDIIAGDFMYIRRYMPKDLKGKIIITNTTTKEDVKMLKERGASHLITTTPRINGRTFGTNAIEAAFASVLQEVDGLEDYQDILRVIDYKPEVSKL